MYNVTKAIKNLDNLCISSDEKEQRIQEFEQLNHSIAYTCSVLHFFWKEDTMVSYKRDERYTIVEMLCKLVLLILCILSYSRNIFTFFLCLTAAIFGAMMGCAIGMSMAAACELIYWIILKPFVKWMNATKGNHLSPRAKFIYKLTQNIILLLCMIFCCYQFYQVYVTFQTRTGHY